jgi:hypothetical protein
MIDFIADDQVRHAGPRRRIKRSPLLVGAQDFLRADAGEPFQCAVPVKDFTVGGNDKGGNRRALQNAAEDLLVIAAPPDRVGEADNGRRRQQQNKKKKVNLHSKLPYFLSFLIEQSVWAAFRSGKKSRQPVGILSDLNSKVTLKLQEWKSPC